MDYKMDKGQMDGLKGEWIDGWIKGRMNGCMHAYCKSQMFTFLTTKFPCASVYCSSVTDCGGTSGTSSPCKRNQTLNQYMSTAKAVFTIRGNSCPGLGKGQGQRKRIKKEIMLKIFIHYKKEHTSCRSCPFYGDLGSTTLAL